MILQKKHKKYFAFSPIVIVCLLILLLHSEFFQKKILSYSISFLEENYKIKVKADALTFSLFSGKVELTNVTFLQQNNSSLLYLKNFSFDLSIISALNSEIEIEKIYMDGININVQESVDSVWNYDFILNSFSSSTQNETDERSSKPITIKIGNISLSNIKLDYKSYRTNDNFNISLKSFKTNLNDSNFSDLIKIESTKIDGLTIVGSFTQSSDTSNIDNSTPSKQPVIISEYLELTNTKFDIHNKNQFKLKSSFETFSISAEKIDLNKSIYSISNLNLINPDISFINLTKNTTESQENDEDPLILELPHIALNIKNTELSNGRIKYEQKYSSDKPITINNLNFSLPILTINLETVRYDIKELSANTSLFPSHIIFATKGSLTPYKSNIDEFTFQYAKSNIHLAAYGPGILNRELNGSLLGINEIEFSVINSKLYPSDILSVLNIEDTSSLFKKPPITNPISVNMYGSINSESIVCNRLLINQENTFKLLASGTVHDYLDESKLNFKNINSEVKLEKDGIKFVNLLSDGMLDLKDRLILNSTIFGDPNNISINTNLIADQSHIALKSHFKPNKNAYKVEGNFNLSNYVSEKNQIGLPNNVNGEIYLSGEGVELNKAKIDYGIVLKSLSWYNYKYEQIHLKGGINEGGVISNQFSVNDSEAIINLNSIISNLDNKPNLNIHGNISKANLSALHLNETIRNFETNINIDISGNSIDSVTGHIVLNNTNLTLQDTSFQSDQIEIKSNINDSTFHFNINSDRFLALYEGNIPITKFSQEIMELLLSHIPDNNPINTSFNSRGIGKLELSLKNVSEIITRFEPDVKQIDNTDIKLNFNSEKGEIDANFHSKALHYSDFQVHNASMILNCSKDSLNYSMSIDSIQHPSVTIPKTFFEAQVAKDTIHTNILVGNELINPILQLTSNLYKNSSTQWLLSFSDHQIFNGENYTINENNFLELNEGESCNGQITLSGKDFTAQLSSKKGEDNSIDYNIDLSGIKLNQVLNTFSEDSNQIDGELKAHVKLKNIYDDLRIEANVELDNISYNNEIICDIQSKILQNSNSDYNISLLANGENIDFKMNNKYNLDSNYINSDFTINKLNLSSLNTFSKEYVDSLNGIISGKFLLKGKVENPILNGDLFLKNVYAHALETNTSYSIEKEIIQVKNNRLLLSKFEISDAWKKQALIQGYIDFNHPEFLLYSIDLNTDDFTVLNTTGTNPKLAYFGLLKSSSNINIHNNNENKTAVDGIIKINSGTELSMRMLDENNYNQQEGLIQFIDKNQIQTASTETELKQSENSNQFELNTRIEVDKAANFNIIVDPIAGDFLTVSGEGNLFLRMEKNGVMTLNGVYEIIEGQYFLSFYDIVKKKFKIDKGSELKWTGDPYNPNTDITCNYEIKTSAKPLLLGESQTNSNGRLPFNVLLHVDGNALKPQISYDIALNSEASTPDRSSIESALAMINRQPDEKTKQVFSLLTFGSFIESEKSENTGSLGTTAYKSVSNMLSNQINNLGQKYIKDFNVNMDVELAETATKSQTAASVTLNLEKGFFDNKIIVAAGSNYSENNSQSNSDLSTDVNLTYRLTEDGQYNLNVFRNGTYEGEIEGDVVKTGITLVFLKNYETFKDLLKKTKKDNE